MRILHVADRLSARGGAYRHFLGVLDGLASSHVQRLAAGGDDASARARWPFVELAGLEATTRAPCDLERVWRDFRPDRVHVHNVQNPDVLDWAAERDAILTIQDHRFFCPGRGKWKPGSPPSDGGSACREPMRRDLCRDCLGDAAYADRIFARTAERLLPAKAMRVHVLSEYMKRELVAVGLASDRVHVIPPFVHDLPLDAPASDDPCVLFVGRLVEAKGVREALDAWRASGVGLPFVAAGTGPLRESLERSGCRALGWVDRRRLASLYRGASVVVLPSRWQEPFGIVGLEALTLGAPVAAWDSGGVAEWHPGTGLVAWGDVEGLGRAIAECAGRSAAPPAGFDRAAQIAKLVSLYESS